MKSKIIALLMCVIVCIFCLFSCMIGESPSPGGDETPGENEPGGNELGGNEPGDDEPGGDDISSEGAVWAPDKALYIIPPKDGSWAADDFVNAVFSAMKTLPVISSDSAQQQGNELVIGESSREISKRAYLRLNRLLEDNDGKRGWIIYSYEGSLCIAYDSKQSAELAASYVKETLLPHKTLVLDDGIVHEQTYDLMELADIQRQEMREEGFSLLDQTLGKNAADELRMLYDLFEPRMYLWLVNLYDPDIGGIYYSDSARDNEGFLPDLESTVQGFSLLSEIGILPHGYTNDLPADMKEKILEFAISLQAEDGYFYHPQWGTNIQISRRGRDLGWAKRIINGLGGTSKYPLPGENVELSPSSYALTAPLGEGAALAASRLVAVAESENNSTLPPHLQSLDNFKSYLDGLDFETRSYIVGNDLAAQHNEIRAAGEEYIDYLVKYLSDRQNPENGLWEEKVTYSSVNGLMKLSSVFWYFGATMPYAEKALESAVEMALHTDLGAFSESDIHVCSVYNPWVAMNNVLKAVEASRGEAAMLVLREGLLEKAPELIKMTRIKIAPFRKLDGGFSYLKDTCSPGSQGVPTAVEGTAESDVNGTAIASTGITDTMEEVFGVKLPEYFCELDREIAMEALENLGSVVKNPPEVIEPETFDHWSEELVKSETQNGVITNLGATATVRVNDRDLDEETNKYKWFATTVVKNPSEGAKPTDYVLKVNTFLRPGEEKTKAESASSVRFDIRPTSRTGDCYTYDADMMVASTEGSSVVGQLFFFSKKDANCFSLNFTTYTAGGKQYLRIGENYQGLDGKKDANIVDKIPVGEWFNFRIEIYRGRDESSNTTVNALIYINGEYKGWCDAGWVLGSNNYFSANPIEVASFSCYRHAQSEIYFNNVLCEKIKKDYVAPPAKPLNDGIYDFTDEPLGESCPNGADTIVQGGEMAVVEVDGNKVFRYQDTSESKSNAMKFDLSEITLEGSNAYLYESEVTINSTANNDMTFGFLNDKGSIILNTSVVLTAKGDKYELVVTSMSDDDSKNGVRLAKTTVGSSFKYAIAYFPDNGVYNMIIDGKVVAAYDGMYTQSSMKVGTSWFWSSGSALLDAYFDNIKVVPAILGYVVPEVGEEDTNTPYYGIYNFEGEDIGTADPEGATVVTRPETTTAVADHDGNKVWHMVNPGTASSLALQLAFAKEPLEGANAYLYETDIKINSIGIGSDESAYLELRIGFLGSGAFALSRLIITNSDDGGYDVKILIDDKEVASAKLTEDFNKITVAYFIERSEFTLALNDVVVAAGSASTSAAPKSSWFWVRENSNMDIFLDNAKIMPVKLTYAPPVETPNTPETPDTSANPEFDTTDIPNVDYDGWLVDPGVALPPLPPKEEEPDHGEPTDPTPGEGSEEAPDTEIPDDQSGDGFLDYDPNGWK